MLKRQSCQKLCSCFAKDPKKSLPVPVRTLSKSNADTVFFKTASILSSAKPTKLTTTYLKLHFGVVILFVDKGNATVSLNKFITVKKLVNYFKMFFNLEILHQELIENFQP